jgi:putative membrane protein
MNRKILGMALLMATAAVAQPCAAQTAPLTDPQIAAIVVTANQVDIDAGTLAKSKTHSKEVRSFAQLMIKDHTGVNKAATELVQKLNVTPEESPTSQALAQGGAANLTHLKQLSGTRFDQSYISHEVGYHESVIDALDKTLIPDAQNAELKALLVKVRPAFVAHLEHAKALQAKLGKSDD